MADDEPIDEKNPTARKVPKPPPRDQEETRRTMNRGVPSSGGESGFSKVAQGASNFNERVRAESARNAARERSEQARQRQQEEVRSKLNRNLPSESGFTKIARAQTPGPPSLLQRAGQNIVHGISTGLGISAEAKANRERIAGIKQRGEVIRRAAAEKSYLLEMENVGIKQGVNVANKPRLSTAQKIAKGLSEFSTESNKRINAVQQGMGEDLLAIAGGQGILGDSYGTDLFGNPTNKTNNTLEKKTFVGRDGLGRAIYQVEKVKTIEVKRGQAHVTYTRPTLKVQRGNTLVSVKKKKKNNGFDPFGF